jgi:hypothetical protein
MMPTARDALEAEFLSKGVMRGRASFYIPYPAALEFLDEAARRNLACLGIEGFTIDGENLVAHLGMVGDFSTSEQPYPSWQDLVKTTNKAGHDYFAQMAREGRRLENHVYNFVLVSEQEYAKLGKT